MPHHEAAAACEESGVVGLLHLGRGEPKFLVGEKIWIVGVTVANKRVEFFGQGTDVQGEEAE